MFASDLEESQGSWCLGSSINDKMVHNFVQVLYATTYVSNRSALPKDRILEVLGVGVANAARHFFRKRMGDCSTIQFRDSTIKRSSLFIPR